MADRVKYFLLGLLFLVVAGVIAYDKWNSTVSDPLGEQARAGAGATASVPPTPPPAAAPVREEPPPRPLEVPTAPPQEREVVKAPPPASSPIRREPAPAPVPPRPAPLPAERTHTVQGGESLEGIALRYYGTRNGVEWIAEKNGIRDPNRIRVNQKLVIPARAESTPAPATNREANRAAKAGTIPAVHVVKAGDGDLYAICRRYYGTGGEGARVARIMDLNGLWSAQVPAGTKLKLPPK